MVELENKPSAIRKIWEKTSEKMYKISIWDKNRRKNRGKKKEIHT